ncbi:MAG: gamma-glutamylcyclotransferase [Actinobacteria bacterium]|nr:gamma-glutamylcyclotransferase [Actinomycetota bacterium]MBI3688323.1 gamma-glutamylcyclotransferase [Actinomycetota bacterium]
MPPINAPSRPATSPTSGRLAPLSADPAPLFVYGSLLFPDVLRVLIDRDPTRYPADVTGWRVIALPDQVYPALIADPAGSTTGHILADITPTEWRTIDAFEADGYHLAKLRTDSDGPAWAYTVPDPHDLPDHPWDLDAFAGTHLAAYLDRCRAWRNRHDATR